MSHRFWKVVFSFPYIIGIFKIFSLIYSVGSPAHTQFCWISSFGGGSEVGSEAQLTVAMAVILTNSAACSASS
jgi:hypothetical protein